MERRISEPDWKLFRQFQQLALERYCSGVLAEVARITADTSQTNHDRYLMVYGLLQQRDEALGEIFNNPRRSAAFLQLAGLRREGLLTDEEFARFSPETRAVVSIFLG